jgi:hypothetical protein
MQIHRHNIIYSFFEIAYFEYKKWDQPPLLLYNYILRL